MTSAAFKPEGVFTSPKISIPKQAASARLTLSFYYLFDCPSNNCNDLDDSITLNVNGGQVIETLTHSVAKANRQWIQHSIDFDTPDQEIQVA